MIEKHGDLKERKLQRGKSACFTYDFGRVRDPHGFSAVGSKEWAEETLAFLRSVVKDCMSCAPI